MRTGCGKAIAVLVLMAVLWPAGALADPLVTDDFGGELVAQAPARMEGNRPQRVQRPQQRQNPMQQLGLTSEQQERMKAVREKARAESQALHEQLKQKRQAMAQYMTSPDADKAKSMQLFREVNSLQQRLGELRISTWFDMREILTPEQLQKMKQMGGRPLSATGGLTGSIPLTGRPGE